MVNARGNCSDTIDQNYECTRDLLEMIDPNLEMYRELSQTIDPNEGEYSALPSESGIGR